MTGLSFSTRRPALEKFPLGLVFLLVSAASFLFFSSSCRLYRLEKRLDPVNAEFISKVKYIITSKERKIFLELPDSEKEAFKKNFWDIRDPDPDTEENEFKVEYMERIDTAAEIFAGEGMPGWLTDRGRIYVLFGPPLERLTYPPGGFAGNSGREIWYYGSFPVVFVDSANTGQYKLVTYDLTGLRSINLMYMHEFSKAQLQAFSAPDKAKEAFDFTWRIHEDIIGENRIEGVIKIDIPYKVIWLLSEGDILKTVLDVHLELKDVEGKIIWKYEGAFAVAIRENELQEKTEKNYKMEIPFILDRDFSRLRLGKNLLYAVVRNRTGEAEAKKVMDFKVKDENNPLRNQRG
jgi:GWxTD domain-containing protein